MSSRPIVSWVFVGVLLAGAQPLWAQGSDAPVLGSPSDGALVPGNTPEDGPETGEAPPADGAPLPGEMAEKDPLGSPHPESNRPQVLATHDDPMPLEAEVDPEPARAPIPAYVGGAAVELVSSESAAGTLELTPQAAFQGRAVRGAFLLGMDGALAPMSSSVSWVQGIVGVGLRFPFEHPYGVVESVETRYQEGLGLGESPAAFDDPLQAYRVTEGQRAVGKVADLRAFSLVAGPRVVVDPSADSGVDVTLGAYMGVSVIYQRAPAWSQKPAPVGTSVAPSETWMVDAGAVYLDGLWLGEVSVAGVGGPRIMGFGRRRPYGRVGVQVGKDTTRVFISLGSGMQRNGAMVVEPLPTE